MLQDFRTYDEDRKHPRDSSSSCRSPTWNPILWPRPRDVAHCRARAISSHDIHALYLKPRSARTIEFKRRNRSPPSSALDGRAVRPERDSRRMSAETVDTDPVSVSTRHHSCSRILVQLSLELIIHQRRPLVLPRFPTYPATMWHRNQAICAQMAVSSFPQSGKGSPSDRGESIPRH